eukprot:2238013-Rhodomonas_salina.1
MSGADITTSTHSTCRGHVGADNVGTEILGPWGAGGGVFQRAVQPDEVHPVRPEGPWADLQRARDPRAH